MHIYEALSCGSHFGIVGLKVSNQLPDLASFLENTVEELLQLFLRLH